MGGYPAAAAPAVAAVATVAVCGFRIAVDVEGAEVLLDEPVRLIVAVALLTALVGAGSVRRAHPAASYFASLGLTCALGVVADIESSAVPLFWLAILTLAIRINGPPLVLILLASLALETTVTAATGAFHGEDALLSITTNSIITYAVFTLLGSVIAHSRAHAHNSRIALSNATRQHADRLARAIDDSRQEMARELHDVAAFHLTGMLVQARAADSVFDCDPQRSRELLAESIVQGQRSMDSLRQSVRVLRHQNAEIHPQPSIADIATLVTDAASTFDEVSYDVNAPDDAFAKIDTGIGLCCYRITQESLANARKHAPGCCVTVQLIVGDLGIELTIENTLPAAGPCGDGFGIAGMRERVRLHGGDLTVGRYGDRWRVRARLPVNRWCRPHPISGESGEELGDEYRSTSGQEPLS